MAREPKQRAGEAIALPFRTFAEIEAHGLVVQAWCSGCHTIRRVELEQAYRNRVFAGARLICKRQVTARFGPGHVTCNSIGLPAIARQEIADYRLIAAEAEAIGRLRDKTGRMRSKRVFALAMAIGCTGKG